MSGTLSDAAGGELFCPTCGRSFGGGLVRCSVDDTALVKLAVPGADPLLGREIDGRYSVRAKLGEGGMGAVYRAWQHSVGREVALKVIAPHATSDASAVKRFLIEAKLASRLSQPNVVTVLDFGQAGDGLLYLAMELVEGDTLEALIQRGPFPLARAVRVAVQLCDALEAAHRLLIVHRDLKPANVMVLREPAGRDLLKVFDFGIARSLSGTEPGITGSRIVGTANYISPEEVSGREVDGRADLYSLGAILYEMLTGARPYGSQGTFDDIVRRQLRDKPVPLRGVPAPMDELVRQLLERDPDKRPVSAALVRARLERIAAELSGGAQPVRPAVTQDTAKASPPRRRRWLWFVAAPSAVAMGAALVVAAGGPAASDRGRGGGEVKRAAEQGLGGEAKGAADRGEGGEAKLPAAPGARPLAGIVGEPPSSRDLGAAVEKPVAVATPAAAASRAPGRRPAKRAPPGEVKRAQPPPPGAVDPGTAVPAEKSSPAPAPAEPPPEPKGPILIP